MESGYSSENEVEWESLSPKERLTEKLHEKDLRSGLYCSFYVHCGPFKNVHALLACSNQRVYGLCMSWVFFAFSSVILQVVD